MRNKIIMNHRSACIGAFFLCAMTTFFAAAPATAARPPNIVVILADDLGYGSVGCYGADPKLVRTPAIDRLAREGRRFTDANTPSSVCSPTRYAVLTGRYCWRTSLKFGVVMDRTPLLIEPGRLTIPSMLKTHGFATAAIGKWHLGFGAEGKKDYTRELTPGPLDVGFDYFYGLASNHGDPTGVYIENRRVAGLRDAPLDPNPPESPYGAKFLGLPAPQREDEQVMSVLTDKAVGWIEKQKEREPFFLYFAPVAVHYPITPSDATRGTSAAGVYGDWIHELDRSVGRILDALDRCGLARDTLVVFTSDNGGALPGGPRFAPQAQAIERGLAINGAWRDGKHSIYEGGFRVPFIARWPGRVPAGTACDETISLVDLLATIAAVVGQPLPPANQAAEDSYNVLPALLDADHARPIRPFVIDHSAAGVFAIRQAGWKWIEGKPARPPSNAGAKGVAAKAAGSHGDESGGRSKPELFDLARDPAETRDQLAVKQERIAALSQLLDRFRRQGYSRPPSNAASEQAPR